MCTTPSFGPLILSTWASTLPSQLTPLGIRNVVLLQTQQVTIMGGPTATFEVGSDGVAIITLQNPPVNALHPAGAGPFPGA